MATARILGLCVSNEKNIAQVNVEIVNYLPARSSHGL